MTVGEDLLRAELAALDRLNDLAARKVIRSWHLWPVPDRAGGCLRYGVDVVPFRRRADGSLGKRHGRPYFTAHYVTPGSAIIEALGWVDASIPEAVDA